MHFLKQAGLMTLLAALAATTAASPAPISPADVAPSAEVTPIVLELEPRGAAEQLESRAAQADKQAVVNTYSGDTCNGSNAQFTVTGAGAYVCHAVSFPVRSIQVSAR